MSTHKPSASVFRAWTTPLLFLYSFCSSIIFLYCSPIPQTSLLSSFLVRGCGLFETGGIGPLMDEGRAKGKAPYGGISHFALQLAVLVRIDLDELSQLKAAQCQPDPPHQFFFSAVCVVLFQRPEKQFPASMKHLLEERIESLCTSKALPGSRTMIPHM